MIYIRYNEDYVCRPTSRLSIDAGVIGPPDASRGLLLISGTHGVEGFAGSGGQVGFFRDSLYEALGESACAIVEATLLVTVDKNLLAVGEYLGNAIVKPGAFWRLANT